MRMTNLALIGLLLSASLATAADSPSPTVAGWNELIDSLRDLPARMLAKLPEPLRQDPQVQQEVGRLALEALTSSALDAIGGDGDHPAFLPQIGQLLNVGQPNADTVYRVARITPGGTYRLRGRRGSLRMAIIGQLGAMPGEAGAQPTGQAGARAAGQSGPQAAGQSGAQAGGQTAAQSGAKTAQPGPTQGYQDINALRVDQRGALTCC
jgi:hypothetical protein